jgi:hypothetical protein
LACKKTFSESFPSWPLWFYFPANIWRRVKFIKLLIVELRWTGEELQREDNKVVTVSYDVLNHKAQREQKIAVKGRWQRLKCTTSLNASISSAATWASYPICLRSSPFRTILMY